MKQSPGSLFRGRVIGSMVVSLLAAAPVSHAQTRFTLVDSDTLINHWPSTDGMIGTQDDVVGDQPSTTNGSAPNSEGAASYNAFDFGQGAVPDANLFPPGRQAITFLDAGGTVTIDDAVAAGGAGALITDWSVTGSEPFPGHGPYTATITAVNSGAYNPSDGVFTQNVDFSANLNSGAANSANFTLSGTAFVMNAADFGTGTGNAYVDSVLIPIAQALNADAMFYAMGSGTVPMADNGGFPEMDVTAVLFGVSSATSPDPVLNVAKVGSGRVEVSWQAADDLWILQSRASVDTGQWDDESGQVTSSEGTHRATFDATEPLRVFRLERD